MQTQPVSTREYLLDSLLLALGLGFFYALWLGSYALFTPDEGRYSEVAREMLVTHDFITPRLNGVVFLDKPILYYWLQASAIYLFGIKEWSLRFWPALLGVLGCIMTYVTGHLIFNRRTGLLAALILATSPLYFGASHYANLDLEVASLIGISLMCFIAAMQINSSSTRNIFLFLAYLFSSFAALTKGMIGIAFPAMIISLWIMLSGRWNTLKKMHLLSGIFLFCIITLPWYVLVQKANPEFFQFFFVKQQVSRFLTTEHFNNQTPFWFYAPIVFGGLFPWCAFVIQALMSSMKFVWVNRHNPNAELYLLIWVFLIFVFFSIPSSKTLGYILPIFPALALLLGKYLSDHWAIFSRGMKIGVFLFISMSLAGVILSFALPYTTFDYQKGLNPYLGINGILLLASVFVAIWAYRKRSSARAIFLMAVTGFLFLLLLTASAKIINDKSVKSLVNQIHMQLKPEDEIVTFYRYYQDLPLYIGRRITIVENWNAQNIALKDNWVRELWYGIPYQNTQDWLISEETFWKRWNSPHRLYVFTDLRYIKKLQQKTTTPIYKIAEYNDTVLLSNHFI